MDAIDVSSATATMLPCRCVDRQCADAPGIIGLDTPARFAFRGCVWCMRTARACTRQAGAAALAHRPGARLLSRLVGVDAEHLYPGDERTRPRRGARLRPRPIRTVFRRRS